MSLVLDKLREVVTSCVKISADDQNDLLIFLPILPEEALNNLLQLFEKNSKLIKEFNENFKARLNILLDGRDRWDKLIAHEEEMLDKEEKGEDPLKDDDDNEEY
jgi:hypothetical protein